VRLCDVLTPASLVKGGGFAVGKIGGIVGNKILTPHQSPAVTASPQGEALLYHTAKRNLQAKKDSRRSLFCRRGRCPHRPDN